MMTKFATGMKNSVGNCWPLSFYSFSEYYDDYYPIDITSRTQKNIFTQAEKIFKEALAICGNDETAARINYMIGNNATIIKRYPNTQVAMIVRGSCDTFIDYHLELKEHFWKYQMMAGNQ